MSPYDHSSSLVSAEKSMGSESAFSPRRASENARNKFLRATRASGAATTSFHRGRLDRDGGWGGGWREKEKKRQQGYGVSEEGEFGEARVFALT